MMNIFDEISRAIASPVSRREALQRVGALLLGTTFLASRARAANPVCGSCLAVGVSCQNNGDCCSNNCTGAPDKTCAQAGTNGFCCSNGDCTTGFCCVGLHACQAGPVCTCSGCGAGSCCCTNNGSCVSSTGGNGSACPAGHAGC